MLIPEMRYALWMHEATLKMRAEIARIAREDGTPIVAQVAWSGEKVYVSWPNGRRVDCTEYAERLVPRKRRFFA